MTPEIARSSVLSLLAQKPLLAAKQNAFTSAAVELASVTPPAEVPPAAEGERGSVVDIVA